MYDKVIKKYTLEEIIKFKKNHVKNLIELLSRYPSYGNRFHIWRKDEGPDHVYNIRRVLLKVIGMTNNQIRVHHVREFKLYLQKLLNSMKKIRWFISSSLSRKDFGIITSSKIINIDLIMEWFMMLKRWIKGLWSRSFSWSKGRNLNYKDKAQIQQKQLKRHRDNNNNKPSNKHNDLIILKF